MLTCLSLIMQTGIFVPNAEVDWKNFYFIAYIPTLLILKSLLCDLASIIYHFPLLFDEMPFKSILQQGEHKSSLQVLEKRIAESLKNTES